jgi:hypothetical protein
LSKQQETTLLVPGPRGWEIWKQSSAGGFALQSAEGPRRASDLSGLPGGNLAMLFPVRGFHALPFKATSSDDSLFDDLAAMHAERLGVRADPMAGQLSDTFVVTKEEESATLLGVVLKSPGEGDLPPRSPNEFDLSARAYPVRGEAIVVWVEFERWVFAFFRNGQLLYSQATSSSGPAPDAACLREIHLALGQLAIQGLALKPETVLVWSPEGDAGSPGSLAGAFAAPVRVSPRPEPVLPAPRSKLLPADVRAARRAAKSRQQKLLGIAAAVAVYLGIGGWFGYGLWQDHRQIQKLENLANEIAPEADRMEYENHLAKWTELDLIVDARKAPVDLLSRVAKCIPPNSGLRLKTAEVDANRILLDGEAPQAAPVSQFNVNIKRALGEYDWNNPPATNTNKGWSFKFEGVREGTVTP